MKNITLEQLEKELLKDKKFRDAAAKLEPEYQLARSLIAARIKKRMTQSEIAKLAKTNQASISRLETGSSKPSMSFLQRIAAALGGKLMVRIEV
ncbi:helix-turn-helix transcriptional regulator [Candidatus Collierbacteria bacterium]|nr:helix-turn-helix transcriptional regulator [Candidatus Collierbacteria bacterium]